MPYLSVTAFGLMEFSDMAGNDADEPVTQNMVLVAVLRALTPGSDGPRWRFPPCTIRHTGG